MDNGWQLLVAHQQIAIYPINMQNTPTRLSTKNLCGPFDQQFVRKFRGKKSQSVSVQLLKLAKTPSVSATGRHSALSQPNILPKLKELQKLAKTDRRKPQKVNKYVDGVSELELYIAKKLVNNQTTQQIVSKIVQNNSNGFENRKVVTDNYLRMTAVHSQGQKFHQIGLPTAQLTQENDRLIKTEYSSGKKWVSDKEFAQKFDKFIIKKHEEESVTGQGTQVGLNEEEAVKQIRSDKATITKIARDMIAEQNNDLLQDEEANESKRDNSLAASSVFQEARGIDWIIKECCQFEKKFKINKAKLKRKK